MDVFCKRLAFISFIFFFSSSCSNRGNLFMSGIPVSRRVSADTEITLHPYDTITSNALVAASSIVAKVDSFLVFATSSEEYSFIVYNEKTDCVELEFPKKGRGPNEQVFSKISQIRRSNGSVEVDILGLNEHSILTIDLYRSIENKQMEVVRRTELPPNTMYAHFYGNSIACIVLFDEYDYTLQILNATSLERENILLPFGLDVYDPGFITCTWRMKEDGTKCLWAMQWANKFNILDLENLDNSASFSTSRRILPDRVLFDRISDKSPAAVTSYYTTAQVTDDDIFLLYRGVSGEDVNKTKPLEIQNFSWEGIYRNRFLIHDAIDTFIVTEGSDEIYGFSWDESRVYKYSLSL